MTNYPTEDRNYKPSFKPPVPILTMGVEIQPEWSDKFHLLQESLGLGPKETVNWVMNHWFSNNDIVPVESTVKEPWLNERSVQDLPVTSHSNEAGT